MKKLICSCFLILNLLFPFNVQSQKLVINPGVDTSSTYAKRAIAFYSKYLNAIKKNEDISAFWKEGKEKYQTKYLVDPMAYAVNKQMSIYKMADAQTILSINVKNNIVSIKTIFNWIAKDEITTLGITNHYIDFKSQKLLFLNPSNFQQKKWLVDKVDNIFFHHPEDVIFNKNKAQELCKSVKTIQEHWGVKEIQINYYYSDEAEDIEQLRGFDFKFARNNRPSGIAYQGDNVVYCIGLGENYFHEIIHLYLGFLPNEDLQEGLAIFYGGSIGQSFEQHNEEAKKFLVANPNFKFEENKLNDVELSNGLSMRRYVEALLCNTIYKKSGLIGLKNSMNYPDLKTTLKKEFDVDTINLDKFIKALIIKN